MMLEFVMVYFLKTNLLKTITVLLKCMFLKVTFLVQAHQN